MASDRSGYGRASMRVRLTAAVGLVAAVFLSLAAWLFTSRASREVLAGVRADQSIVATVSETVPMGGRAAQVYAEIEQRGLLPAFYELLGVPVPDRPVVIQDEPPVLGAGGLAPTGPAAGVAGATPGEPSVLPAGSVSVAADIDDPSTFVLPAMLVVELGEPLLSGVAPADVLIVDGSGNTSSGVFGVSVGDGLPVAAVPVANVKSSVSTIGRDLYVAAGLLTAAAMVATWLLTGRALRPVEAITRRVDEISRAGSGERVPVPAARDEIGHLARTVNTMLDRLDEAALRQRRFVADASHELRSPLSIIRAETEVALAHPERTEWPAVTRNVAEEANRLEGLVNDLLVLAQGDDERRADDAPAARLGTVDVEEVVLEEAARHRRVPVDVSAVLAGRVHAAPVQIARIARHLLDNAARHARRSVAVSVHQAGRQVVLIVDDDGDGVPPAERTRIFERFARLEDSRSRDSGGAGLGLAVVASMVGSLGGTVSAGDAPPPLGGARFEVRLPALED